MTFARFRNAAPVATALAALAACNASPPGMDRSADASVAASADCVVIADGFYEAVDGQLLVIPSDRIGGAGASGWQGELQTRFVGLGFPWMNLKVRERVATLTGTAPSVEAKQAALDAAERAIAEHPEAGAARLLVVDGISVEGGERGVGTSLAALAEEGASLESCQRAFTETMQGRNIQFESGNANISPVSARLLDAVSGVATLCSAFGIEIGGHTDSRGADDFNLQLSQLRADAVRDYLAAKGVSTDNLLSVGYGETRPLDPALTPEAYDRNRRTEFRVIAR